MTSATTWRATFFAGASTALLAVSPAMADHAASPEQTVLKLFDAMRAGDGDAIRALAAENAPLDRVRADGSVERATIEDWATSIDGLGPGRADEQIFDVRTRDYGGLASVWAPFILYVDGELRSCGVNHFTLAQTGGTWRVIHGVDTHYSGDCATFRDTYAEASR
ncbi:MAG: hypothetical protein AAGJ29_13340 [Pseudomonadota bacterium]